MGVIQIIIYYIYNNLIWVGVGYSFSMWQTLQMWQMLSKCILDYFSPKIGLF